MAKRALWLTAWLLGALLIQSPPAAAQTTAPKLRSSAAAAPYYPSIAYERGVEGDVAFRAHVHPDGMVKSVEILSVPAVGLGFEDAIVRAVSSWQFEPALQDGVPVESIYESRFPFELTLAGEYVYPVPPRDVWGELKRLVKDLKLGSERVNEDRQFLITKSVRYRTELFPTAESLGLVSGVRPIDVHWYLSVPPDFETARIAIGAVVTFDRRGLLFYSYNGGPLEEWLLDRLTERIGRKPEPLSGKPDRRAKQSRAISSQGTGNDCSAGPGPALDPKATGTALPTPIATITPFYPPREYAEHRQGRIVLGAVVTEHGTLIRPTVQSPHNAPEGFVIASQAAASLWKFIPARVAGCPAMTQITIEMSFTLR